MGMAGGAKYVKGTFTVPDSSDSYFALSFGKTFTKYLLLIEADDTSKQIIDDSNINASRAYALSAVYPTMQIGDKSASKYVYYRIHPQTKSVSVDGNNNGDLTDTGVSLYKADLMSGSTTNAVFRGLTYNYYVVEIK